MARIWKHGGKKKESFVKKMFRSYLVWIMVCILMLQCGTLVYVGRVINQNVTETQRQLTLSMNQNIENYFQSMDDFSRKLVRSEEFQKIVQEELPQYFDEGRNTADLFSELYIEAYEMIQKKYHIGVVTKDNHYIWLGSEYYIDKIQGERPDTYQDYEMDGTPEIQYVKQNAYLRASMGDRNLAEGDSPMVTLSRSFGRENYLYNGSAMLEIQVDAEKFAYDILKRTAAKKNTGIKVHILNAQGDTIYSESGRDGKNILEENGWKEGTYQKNRHYIYVYRIFGSELYVLYTINLFDYYNEFLVFLGISLTAFLLIFLLMVSVSRHVSLRLSKPILELCEEMEKVDLDKGKRFQSVETDVQELDYLSKSIETMNRNLEESMHRVITLKDYEIQSRMMALQAQMQPHFLVNTLTTMGSMAEQRGNRDISRMCVNLTQMFRYIAAEETNGVQMYEEIRHVNRYVDIMKERFPNARVEIDIPLEMMDVHVPKLIIQPLVENSFKYCNRSQPYIRVQGEMSDEGNWRVKVTDNGEGFSGEKAAEILRKCEESMEGVNSLSTKIDGMGLVNVYVRLRLFYRSDVIYQIGREGIEIGRKVS